MKAIIYDRVSVRDESSQQEHLRRCRAFCKARGWRVVAEHTDTASGFRRDAVRPGWERVQAAVRDGKCEAVVVFAVSRAGRNLAAFAKFVEECRDRGITFASATEPIDTSGPFGTAILALLSALAEMESLTKRERALVGREVAARRGTWTGGRRPYGFRPEPSEDGPRLIVDEEEAGHIRAAAEVILNGGSLVSAAEAMNARGARTIGGEPWYGASIPDLLTRDVNAPDILTPSTLTRVRRAVGKRRVSRGRRPRYLLTGIAECGICGARLRGKPVKGVPKYVCITTGSLHLSIRADTADAAVLAATDRMLPPEPERVEDPGEVPEELAAELRDVEAKLEALGEAVESGTLSEAAFRGRERKLSARVEELQRRIEKALPRGSDVFKRLLEEMERGDTEPTPEEQREWVEFLVEKVIVRPGRSDRVEVHAREGVRPQPTP